MDNSIIHWVVNGLMGIVMWFMKTTLSDLKEQNKEFRHDLEYVKNTYFKRADFTEFKEELFARLDRDHDDIIRQISNRQ
jgi:hypothetical protein